MPSQDTVRTRATVYTVTAVGLTLGYTPLRGNTWQGGATLHTVMEGMSTLLAVIVGAMALVHYYSKKESVFLLVGVGFLGTGFLDGYHALVTSAYFKPFMPSDLPTLIPWSWVASRQFLSIFMALSWLVWWRENKLGQRINFRESSVFILSAVFAVVSCLFFAFFPLPPAYYPDALFHRPEEFAPAIFFLMALIGYLYKGAWKQDVFEHWLVLSLIIGFVSQAVFMSFSGTLFDIEFDVAHTLKKVSYICVLTGLLFSMRENFYRAEEDKKDLVFQKHALDEHAIVSITDVKGRIIYCNDKFCHISGFPREELIGQNHRLLNSGEHPYDFFTELWETISSGKTWHGDIKNKTKSGEPYWVRATIVPGVNEKGLPFQYVAIRTDITERKVAEEALIESREEALSAVRAKASFLANMSHEIRTPMNGVIGMLELLHGTELDDEQTHYVDTATKSADMQITVINDILDFSKIEAGRLDLEYMDFQACDVLEDISSLLVASANAKGVLITCYCDPDIPINVKGDPTRLRQILANLVGNAVKFTDKGEINVSATLLSSSEGVATVRFKVHDTGIGIDRDAVEVLFEAFTQADVSTTRQFGGTGLGLSISSSLVALMGSIIEVRSEKGVGSTFWFDVQFPIGEALKRRKADNLEGIRVLVVDDTGTNLEILRRYLEAWRMKPVLFSNSNEALAFLRKTEEKIDLAILDYHMPEKNGLELAKEISQDESLDTPPMMMLSSSQPDDLDSVQAAGILLRLNKPVGRSRLLGGIISAMGGHENDAEETETQITTTGAVTGRVLLVEDAFINQQVAVGMLGKMGIQPDIANNGREATEKVIERKYDLILMDIQMPEMDGYEATAFILEHEKKSNLPHTPIVAMTAHALEGDREKCLDAGMDDYIAKPIRQEIIETVVRKWISSSNDSSELGPRTEGPGGLGDDILDPDALVILKTALEALPDGYRKVLNNFLESVPDHFTDIGDAISSADPLKMEHSAHKLKSSSATLGALFLSELAGRVEYMASEGETSPAADLLAEMEQEYIRVRPAIKQVISEG